MIAASISGAVVLPSAFRRCGGIACVTCADARALVLPLHRVVEQQSPYVFEGPSFEIWTRIDGTRTEEQIVDELVELYDAPREQIAVDVHSFLAQLLELHLIEDVEEPSKEADEGDTSPASERASTDMAPPPVR